ncbi:hypothetical protein SAY87_018402 [Trapa incisa]|uniref:Protein ecdysoneless homolog n=1 Tax=Trapa incisa TaxID=236973 RepID=A0AAN7L3Z8_9MYRT|nr:hypothetical protein SAY87_018402 [Trapa incisa]
MAAPPQPSAVDSDLFTSIFSHSDSRLPEDAVFYAIFPDPSLSSSFQDLSLSLQSLRHDILAAVSSFTSSYIWQHEPFSLTLSPSSLAEPLHLRGKVRYGDNLEDEWFVVFLVFYITRQFPHVSARVWDTDGEFLLIEAAFHLPRWLDPSTSLNRVFIRRGDLHIVPKSKISSPSITDSLKFLITNEDVSRAGDSIQAAIKSRISDYPERARRNMHRARAIVPPAVAQVLRHDPCLISVAVEGFYDRDIDSMKFASKMEKFLPRGRDEELVLVSVPMSRAMYAQLVQQTFQAPKCYPMPSRSNIKRYSEAELGMKISCGLEMAYQLRMREGAEGRGTAWDEYKKSLERIGYFEGLIPGSNEYKRLTEKAEDYYRNSSLFLQACVTMSTPVRRIDEILPLPHSADDFKSQEVPPSDDDSWLYNGEDELNSALEEREKEMELYDAKIKNKQKSRDSLGSGPSSSSNNEVDDLGNIAKSMQAFMQKVSSFQGAEIPQSSDSKEVDLDVDRFMKEMETIMRCQGNEDSVSDLDIEEGSSSDMDFDESEIDSDAEEEDDFSKSYADVLSKELKSSTLSKSFIRANEQTARPDEVGSSSKQDMDVDDEFSPVDVDVNLVKSLLDSFASQEGLPGPASNLLGLMGVRLPKDESSSKGK